MEDIQDQITLTQENNTEPDFAGLENAIQEIVIPEPVKPVVTITDLLQTAVDQLRTGVSLAPALVDNSERKQAIEEMRIESKARMEENLKESEENFKGKFQEKEEASDLDLTKIKEVAKKWGVAAAKEELMKIPKELRAEATARLIEELKQIN